MFRQLWVIAKVWAFRPLIWLLIPLVAFVALASNANRNTTRMVSARLIPGETEVFGPIRLDATTNLRDGRALQKSAAMGDTDASVVGIDLKAMDLRDPSNELQDFSQLQHALKNYPSVRWIRFDQDQIQQVDPTTWGQLTHLNCVILCDHVIEQADIDQIAEIPSLEKLVIQSMDFRASLKPFSELPDLAEIVLSHGTFNMTDRPVESLFRREIFLQLHELTRLRRLVLIPQWIPGEGYFAGSSEPDPACDPVLKQNAAETLAGHPALTDLWIGSIKHERSGKDLASVQAALPDVHVRSARYNENSVTRAVFGVLAIVLLLWPCLYNMSAHFSLPQRRVVPNYVRPHKRYLYLFATLATAVATAAIHSRVSIDWLPALAISAMSVALAFLMITNMTITMIRNPSLVWLSTVILLLLFSFQITRALIRQLFPSFEPALDYFLSGHQPWIAIAITLASWVGIVWFADQACDQDRLNAEAGLPPLVTVEDFGRQNEILGLQRYGKNFQRALDSWQSKLQAVQSMTKGWRRAIRLDWLGESSFPFHRWMLLLAAATVFAFVMSRVAFSGRDFALMYLCVMAVAAGVTIPTISSLTRREVLPFEILLPLNRTDYLRRRTISVGAKFAYLFLGLLIFQAAIQYTYFQRLDISIILRSAIVYIAMLIACTGLVLWMLSIRNIFAFALLVTLGLVLVIMAAFSGIDFRDMAKDARANQVNQFFSSPWFFIGAFILAGVLLWSGKRRLLSCELARQ